MRRRQPAQGVEPYAVDADDEDAVGITRHKRVLPRFGRQWPVQDAAGPLADGVLQSVGRR